MSAGTSVTESSAAAAIAKVLVSASGRNSRPSWSSRVNTGRNDSVMMRSDMNSAGPTSRAEARLPEQRAPQWLDGPVDQVRAVVGRHDPHAGRQRGRDLGDPLLHAVDHAQRVLAIAHHHDPTDGLPSTIPLGDPEPQVGP